MDEGCPSLGRASRGYLGPAPASGPGQNYASPHSRKEADGWRRPGRPQPWPFGPPGRTLCYGVTEEQVELGTSGSCPPVGLRSAFSPGKPSLFQDSLRHQRAGLLRLPRSLDEGAITKGPRSHHSHREKNRAGITNECALRIQSPSPCRGKEVSLEMPVLSPISLSWRGEAIPLCPRPPLAWE